MNKPETIVERKKNMRVYEVETLRGTKRTQKETIVFWVAPDSGIINQDVQYEQIVNKSPGKSLWLQQLLGKKNTGKIIYWIIYWSNGE